VGWAQAFRDFAIRFSTSENFVPFLGFIVAMVIAIKTPSSEMIALAKVLFTGTSEGTPGLSVLGIVIGFGGWILALIFLLTSATVVWIGSRIYKREIERLVSEKSELQKRILDDRVQHPVKRKEDES
jgi:hypothetical protein